ncbi:MAG: alpha/beta hydrolase [Acutalibacter sp.]|jgi:alpha-beta hydrolase superfamily lysophospholipase|uniref:alpha/beta hydrolase n=1 Tax=Acutalibacter sp. TaxID=1918636 RepID=UPI002171226D|nr:alpha/beta hydrolase [Acutalibacter sp.]MCI9224920.1 alpha/beta hydrolase [Acutalibacter sp.]
MEIKEWFRPASSGWGQIFSRSWVEESSRPRAVIVIAHGMAEHSGRYSHFARFLAGKGFAVYMNDHAGHGRSAQIKGHFADNDGWECVVKDLCALMDQAVERHPGLPVFMLGHSMGSFLTRSFITRYGQRLAGCIICGTMGKNPGVPLGKAIASAQIKLLGPRSTGRRISRLSSAGYNKRIENPVNDSAWLSTDDEVCRVFEADPLSNFPFTAAGYRDLFIGLGEISSPDWARKVPKELPVFLIAGDQDPVGNYGAGPRQVADWLQAAGVHSVQLKLYPGMRHEVLNEIGREEVYGDVLEWLEGRL